jgi:hypothetical protein
VPESTLFQPNGNAIVMCDSKKIPTLLANDKSSNSDLFYKYGKFSIDVGYSNSPRLDH